MDGVVDGVVLFIPVEGDLSMALERDPQLLEYAFSKNIILTFTTSLLAISKGLAMTIQQIEIAKHIDDIQSNAVELHKRFRVFIDKCNDIGNRHHSVEQEIQRGSWISAEPVVATGPAFCRAGRAKRRDRCE